MIQVIIDKTNVIQKITLNGHAEFADYGKDIVCASASTLFIYTINLIEQLIDGKCISYQCDLGYAYIEVIKSNRILNTILLTLEAALNDLQCQYPQNIKFS